MLLFILFFLVAHPVHRSFAPTTSESDPGRTPGFGGWVSQQEFLHTVRLELETSLKRHQAAYHLSQLLLVGRLQFNYMKWSHKIEKLPFIILFAMWGLVRRRKFEFMLVQNNTLLKKKNLTNNEKVDKFILYYNIANLNYFVYYILSLSHVW